MFLVGVDENGLGPRLGPLVATAVSVELSSYDVRALRRFGRRTGIYDSKETSGFGRMAPAEALSLALIERLSGRVPEDVDALFESLSIDALGVLRSECPNGTHRQCWGEPMLLPVFDGCIDDGRRLLDKLERKGVVPRRARSVISCVGTMNRAFERGTNKFVMDLSMFERLLLDAQAAFGCELQAVCGMVGGLRRYGSYFQHFTDRTVEVLREEAGVSSYRIDGIGDVCFEVDADAGHLPVGLASMLGKYVREVAVERQTRFYRNHDGELPRASGYRDPVTRKFVTSSLDLRVRLGIADACFERRS